jgi:hypothetical protein
VFALTLARSGLSFLLSRRARTAPTALLPASSGRAAFPGSGGLFAGIIGVGVLVRRLLQPGRQKFQIEKIRRFFLLGHESLYAKADGCKIARKRKAGPEHEIRLTTPSFKLVANVIRHG